MNLAIGSNSLKELIVHTEGAVDTLIPLLDDDEYGIVDVVLNALTVSSELDSLKCPKLCTSSGLRTE